MNRTIRVTGASKGIGQAIAIRLACNGFHIVVHYGKDSQGAADTLNSIHAQGGEGRLLSFDIANRSSCLAALKEDIENYGAYYGAVLSAGITQDNAFPAMEDDEWDRVLNTNMTGFYNVLKPIVMPMISNRKGGRIVTLSSVSGITGNRGQVNYSASKAGIIGATKALAVELAKRSITVNCVAPGVINTQMTQDFPPDIIAQMVPMRRAGSPDEVAAVVAFLCSDEASYVTRQVISVNGGMM